MGAAMLTSDLSPVTIVNAAMCVTIAYVCFCRLCITSGHVRADVRAQFVMSMVAAVASAFTPAFGHPVTWGQLLLGACVLSGLLIGRRRWPGRPPAEAMKKGVTS